MNGRTTAAVTAEQLGAYTRTHGGIENRLHHGRDEPFREDRGRVRPGQATQVLASLRNVAIHRRRERGAARRAAAAREMAARPGRAHLTSFNL